MGLFIYFFSLLKRQETEQKIHSTLKTAKTAESAPGAVRELLLTAGRPCPACCDAVRGAAGAALLLLLRGRDAGPPGTNTARQPNPLIQQPSLRLRDAVPNLEQQPLQGTFPSFY